jgi:hypothetical protein
MFSSIVGKGEPTYLSLIKDTMLPEKAAVTPRCEEEGHSGVV